MTGNSLGDTGRALGGLAKQTFEPRIKGAARRREAVVGNRAKVAYSAWAPAAREQKR